MGKFLKTAIGTLVAGASLVAAMPAEARPGWGRGYYGGGYGYRGYRGYRGHSDAGVAIGAGVLGLALGAAIASDRGRGYYDGPRYYNDGYYGRPYGYGYGYRSCYTRRVWDPYIQRPVSIRYCD